MEDEQAAPPASSRDDWKRFHDIRVHPNTADALTTEAVIQSAAKGRPIFSRDVASHVLNQWSLARSREAAARRLARAKAPIQRAEG